MTTDTGGFDRRRFLGRSAAAGAAVWAAPGVLSVSRAAAQGTPPPTPPCGTTLVYEGQLGTAAPRTPQDTGQDQWTFELTGPSSDLTVLIEDLDNALCVEFQVYQGTGIAGPLVLDPTNGCVQGPHGANALPAGVYTIAVEDAFEPPQEWSGRYRINLSSTNPICPGTQIVDEGPETMRADGSP